MFQTLFKYPIDEYQRGALELDVGWPVFLVVAVVALVLIAWAHHRWARAGRIGRGRWLGLTLLHGIAATLILFSLSIPRLVVDQRW